MKYVCVTGRLIPWLLALMVVSGCSGIEPLELTNTREEGPEKGLFSGSDGEFVILRRSEEDFAANADEPVADEASKVKEQIRKASVYVMTLAFFLNQRLSAQQLSLGKGFTASYGIASSDLSGTNVIATSTIVDLAGGMLFRQKSDDTLTDLSINYAQSGFNGLSRKNRLRYDTPKVYGAHLAVSAISDQRYDAGLYGATWLRPCGS